MYPIRNNKPLRCEPKKKYSNYRSYKDLLCEDFKSSCGYCGIHHIYFGEKFGFHIDHFAPKSKFPHLKDEYSNLIYSCPVCNCAKSNDWCGDDEHSPIKDNSGYVDPCDPGYDELFYRNELGKICAAEGSCVAEYMHKKLKFSLRRHSVYWMVDKLKAHIIELTEILVSINHEHPLDEDIRHILKKLLEAVSIYEKEQKS